METLAWKEKREEAIKLSQSISEKISIENASKAHTGKQSSKNDNVASGNEVQVILTNHLQKNNDDQHSVENTSEGINQGASGENMNDMDEEIHEEEEMDGNLEKSQRRSTTGIEEVRNSSSISTNMRPFNQVVANTGAYHESAEGKNEWRVQGANRDRWKKVSDQRRKENAGELKASSRPAKCYVGKCASSSTVQGIKKHVEDIVLKETKQRVDCVVMELKKEGYEAGWSKSFVVTVPVFIKPLILIERFWPTGLVVRNFFEKKRKNEENRSSS